MNLYILGKKIIREVNEVKSCIKNFLLYWSSSNNLISFYKKDLNNDIQIKIYRYITLF